MVKKKIQVKGEYCPVARALRVMGERWTVLVLRDLFIKKQCRYREFSDSLKGASPNIISDRLKKLIAHGIVTTQQYSEHPPRNEYVLTAFGRSLGPLMMKLRDWGREKTIP